LNRRDHALQQESPESEIAELLQQLVALLQIAPQIARLVPDSKNHLPVAEKPRRGLAG
jgi:hypothetical protein